MKKKKIISLSLVAILTLSLALAGCGSSTPVQNTQPETTQPSSANNPSSSSGVMWDSDLNISANGTVSANSASKESFGGFDWSFSDLSLTSDSYLPDDYQFNTSEYDAVKESRFLSVRTTPLSTFAADVDTASYTNLRAILMDKSGEYSYYAETVHDVRIEEMLNYFNYNLKGETQEVFTVSTEISRTPWNPDTQLLVVNVKAKELPKEEHEGSNLVFLVDTSGSMDDELKLPLLIDSLELLVEELTEKDTISIVTYASNDRVVLEGASGNEKERIIAALRELDAYGSTNGEGGLKKAYQIAKKYKNDHSNSRIIMCSDGDLNVGMSSTSDLMDFVEKKRQDGIYLSVLGFGLGNYKDNKMETLADNGNGNYHYIDCAEEGRKVLVEDLMSTLVTLADDVKFQIEFNPKHIKGYRKIGYENRNLANEDFHDDTKDGGEVGYGHEVTIVYEIVPADSALNIGDSDLKYQNHTTSNSQDWCSLSIRYKPHGKWKSQLLEYTIDESNYTDTPSTDWKFISDVVGFGLLVNESDYVEDLTISDLISDLYELELDDEYKEEFLSLVKKYQRYIEEVK